MLFVFGGQLLSNWTVLHCKLIEFCQVKKFSVMLQNVPAKKFIVTISSKGTLCKLQCSEPKKMNFKDRLLPKLGMAQTC